MSYTKDRQFTDIIHKIAVNQIYSALRWQEVSIIKEVSEWIDINCGIDYFFKDIRGKILTVQERFRDQTYSKNYNDFTLRYRRDLSTFEDRVKSEFYKIKADFFLYGVINFNKSQVIKGQVNTDDIKFLKYILVNLHLLFKLEQDGYIQISESGSSYFDKQSKKLIVSLKGNRDSSSSFVAFDVSAYFDLLNYLGVDKESAVPLHYGFHVNNY